MAGDRVRDWPRYRRDIPDDDTADLVASQAAMVALCDAQLGRLLDAMDDGWMWDDTALIVTRDHGFMLDKHGSWGKNRMPFFAEIAHIPLFVHVPGQTPGRSTALSQNIDVMATLLDLFGVDQPDSVQGRSLLHPGFDFTQGMPVLKIPAVKGAKRLPMQGGGFDDTETVLYDLTADPGQRAPFRDAVIEARFCAAMSQALRAHDAPPELYARFDLELAP